MLEQTDVDPIVLRSGANYRSRFEEHSLQLVGFEEAGLLEAESFCFKWLPLNGAEYFH